MKIELYCNIRELRNKFEKYHFDTVRFPGATLAHKSFEFGYETTFDIMHELAEVIIVSIQKTPTPTDMDCDDMSTIRCDIQITDLDKMISELYSDTEQLLSDFYKAIKDEKDEVIQNILQDNAKKLVKICGSLYSLTC